MRITKQSEIYVGMVMYHVYGCNRMNTKVDASEITKLTVLEMPQQLDSIGVFVKVKIEYVDESIFRSHEDHRSIHDMGILDGEPAYNLNRVFTTRDDALLFMRELQLGKYSHMDDIEFSLKTDNSWWYDENRWEAEEYYAQEMENGYEN